MERLADYISKAYALKIHRIETLREFIGQVCILQSGHKRYVLKLFPRHKRAVCKQA